MAYIEVHQALRDHRKILALADELGMEEAHVAGHCVFLWLWSLDNAPDGTLPASKRSIERAAGWHGESGAFVAALVSVGMLDQDADGALRIHDWYEYAGRLIDRRKADAERKRAARNATPSAPPPDTSSNDVCGTSGGHPADIPTPSSVPYPTVPDPSQAYPTPSQPTSAAAASRASAREATTTVTTTSSGGGGGETPAETENKKAVKPEKPTLSATETWLAEIIPRASAAVRLTPANPDALRAVLLPYHARDADAVVAELFACKAFYDERHRKLDVRLINNWLKDWIERERKAHAQEQAAAAASSAGSPPADSGRGGAGSGPRGPAAYAPSQARYGRAAYADEKPDPSRNEGYEAMFKRRPGSQKPNVSAVAGG